MTIVAIVGPIAAGKGTAADIFIEQGYVPFNYGDIIYEERTAQGLKEERHISNAVGAGLRLKFGNDIITKRLAHAIKKHPVPVEKALIDGLRHPDEVRWMKENLGAQVIGITASPEVRYQRAMKRNRPVDPKTPEGFTEVDRQDRGTNSKQHENQTDGCIYLADIVIENNDDDIEAYKQKIYDGLTALGLYDITK